MRFPATFAGTVVCAVLLTCSASAQEGLAGKGEFPQARTVSGLSGGASAVLPSGFPGSGGALALSTPIGYTLAGNHAVLLGGATSADGRFRWFDGETTVNGSNGSAALIFGVSLGDGNLAVSLVQTSRLSEDRVVNLQFSPRTDLGRFGVSVGVQDLLDATVTTPDYDETTQSLFAACTYAAGSGIHLTAGGGTVRFQRGFGGASFQIVPGISAMAEHDGFGWNYGASVRLGGFKASNGPADIVVFLGSCQGKYATWNLSMRF